MNATIVTFPGHNNPPANTDDIAERLAERHDGLLQRCEDLICAVDRVPGTIATEEEAAAVADFIKQLQACAKNADALRVEEKEPYLEGGRRIDGFFKKRILEPLIEAKRRIEVRLTTYQRRRADAERREREEEARHRRAEAEALRRAAEAKAAAMTGDDELSAALIIEEHAQRASADAARAARAASVKLAEMSRSRTDHGTVASLHTVWTFSDLERDRIDLEALRPHIPQAALEQAVRSFIKAGGRHLHGVRIYEDHHTVVR